MKVVVPCKILMSDSAKKNEFKYISVMYVTYVVAIAVRKVMSDSGIWELYSHM